MEILTRQVNIQVWFGHGDVNLGVNQHIEYFYKLMTLDEITERVSGKNERLSKDEYQGSPTFIERKEKKIQIKEI